MRARRTEPDDPIAISYRLPGTLRTLGRSLPRGMRRAIRRRWFRKMRPWDPRFKWEPPPCPEGMEVGPPDFVGIGIGSAGTTWWWRLIRKHPGVYNHPALHRERRYLEHEFLKASPGEDAAAGYAAWFPRPPGMLAGEWTPWYMTLPWIGHVLSVVAPDAKILVMLRDPIERYVSVMTKHLWQDWYSYLHTARHQYACGLYAYWLALLEPHISRDQLLVLQYERCCVDPEAELARTLEFLGLDVVIPDDLDKRVAETVGPKLELDSDMRQELIRGYEPDVGELVERYPEIDRSLWPNFA